MINRDYPRIIAGNFDEFINYFDDNFLFILSAKFLIQKKGSGHNFNVQLDFAEMRFLVKLNKIKEPTGFTLENMLSAVKGIPKGIQYLRLNKLVEDRIVFRDKKGYILNTPFLKNSIYLRYS